jgi:hypothetical protein
MSNTWLPIEEAPKDGTLIDLWVGDERVTDCKWFDTGFKKWEWYAGDYDWVSVELWYGTPTHFMPIPGPPADAK